MGMEIRLAPYSYLISLLLAIFAFTYFITKLTSKKNKNLLNPRLLSYNNFQPLTILFYLVYLFIFIISNILSLVIAYKKGFYSKTPEDPTKLDLAVLLLHVISESLKKSVFFLVLLFFTPVISEVYKIDSKLEQRIITIYSLLRIVFYPVIFTCFYDYPVLGFYFIQVTDISETIILSFMYLFTFKNLGLQFQDIKTSLRKRLLIKIIFENFKKVALILTVQFSFEIINKLLLFLVTFSTKVTTSTIALDFALFLQNVNFVLQFWSISALTINLDEDLRDFLRGSEDKGVEYIDFPKNKKIEEKALEFVIEPNKFGVCEEKSIH